MGTPDIPREMDALSVQNIQGFRQYRKSREEDLVMTPRYMKAKMSSEFLMKEALSSDGEDNDPSPSLRGKTDHSSETMVFFKYAL